MAVANAEVPASEGLVADNGQCLTAKMLKPNGLTTFKGRLEAALKVAGLAQNQLEKRAGLTTGRINKMILLRKKDPPPAIQEKLATVLRQEPAWLAFGVGRMRTEFSEAELAEMAAEGSSAPLPGDESRAKPPKVASHLRGTGEAKKSG